jgi:succinate dehydrogenase hydrophobic anchor subunit
MNTINTTSLGTHRAVGDAAATIAMAVRVTCVQVRDAAPRFDDDRGEGVISAAIAVLIVAFIGALMWVGMRSIWEDTETNTKEQITKIGQ